MRRLPIVLAVIGLVVFGAAPVLAAAPTNDSSATPAVLAEPLPTSATEDVTEATADPADRTDCFGNNLGTVWYTYTPSTSGRYIVDTFGSTYDTTLYVLDGSPSGSILGCDWFGSRVVFDATAGNTYFIQVGAPDGDTLGTLTLNLDVAPPPLALGLTVNATGTVNRLGTATIGGTVSCNVALSVTVNVNLTQPVGKLHSVHGGINFNLDCTPGGPIHWTKAVPAFDGKFATGSAFVSGDVNGCDVVDCVDQQLTTTVALRH